MMSVETTAPVLVLVKIALMLGGIMTAAAYFVLLERRVAAWVQDRHGPNRVGIPLTKIRLMGLGQPLADGLKMIFKEEYIPAQVDRPLYIIAPIVIMTAALAAFAAIPLGSVVPEITQLGIKEPIPLLVATQLDVGMLYVFALSSIAVYGVILGGWSSNSKYSFLGGLRSSAANDRVRIAPGPGDTGCCVGMSFAPVGRHHPAPGRFRGLVRLGSTAGICRLPGRRICGSGSTSLRFDRVRTGVSRRLPHGIWRNETCSVSYGGIYPHDNRIISDRDFVFRWMAFVGRYGIRGRCGLGRSAIANGGLDGEDVWFDFLFYVDSLELAEVSLRSADVAGLEGHAATGAIESGGGGHLHRARPSIGGRKLA